MAKMRVTFKSPDGVWDSVRQEAEKRAGPRPVDNDWEWRDERDEQHKTITTQLEWAIEYKEYITIEFDLEKGTATVVPCHE